MMIQMLIRHRV